MLVSRGVAALILCLSGAFWGAAQARPISPAEDRTIGYDGDLPSCDDWGVLNMVQGSFDWKQFWFEDKDLSIHSFQQAREIGFRKHGADFIPRRYCEASALFSDGRTRQVKYNIIERGGFIGIGSGVEFCAVGEDKAHAYSPHCDNVVR